MCCIRRRQLHNVAERNGCEEGLAECGELAAEKETSARPMAGAESARQQRRQKALEVVASWAERYAANSTSLNTCTDHTEDYYHTYFDFFSKRGRQQYFGGEPGCCLPSPGLALCFVPAILTMVCDCHREVCHTRRILNYGRCADRGTSRRTG